MIDAFPPLPVEEIPTAASYEAVELLDIDSNDDRPDMSRDILWVYENLVRERVNPEDAPSLGAWAQLKWARENRNRFFEQVLPKAKATEKEAEEDEARLADRPDLRRLRQIRVGQILATVRRRKRQTIIPAARYTRLRWALPMPLRPAPPTPGDLNLPI
jgi:hypothetical protein